MPLAKYPSDEGRTLPRLAGTCWREAERSALWFSPHQCQSPAQSEGWGPRLLPTAPYMLASPFQPTPASLKLPFQLPWPPPMSPDPFPAASPSTSGGSCIESWALCLGSQQFKGWIRTKTWPGSGGGGGLAFVPLLGPTICVKPLHKSQLQRPPCHHDPNNGSRAPLQSHSKAKKEWFLYLWTCAFLPRPLLRRESPREAGWYLHRQVPLADVVT